MPKGCIFLGFHVRSNHWLPMPNKETWWCWVLVAHICNASYLGVWDQENLGSKSAQANSSWDPISKTTTAKWTGSVAQGEECLFCKHEVLSSNSTPTKKNEVKEGRKKERKETQWRKREIYHMVQTGSREKSLRKPFSPLSAIFMVQTWHRFK
jgi:hypothetical protein